MIDSMVGWCLDRRWLVVVIFMLLVGVGIYSWFQLALEAYPDIADTTAQVVTQYPGHAAEEMEQQVTMPLERELAGTPGPREHALTDHVRPVAHHAGVPRWCRRLLGAATHQRADPERDPAAGGDPGARSHQLTDRRDLPIHAAVNAA